MKRVVIWGWHSPSVVSAVKSLEKRQLIEVVAWIGKVAECTHELNQLLHRFKLDRLWYSGVADPICEQFYGILSQLQELYSRVSFSMARSFQETLHIFNGYCDYFAAIFEYECHPALSDNFNHLISQQKLEGEYNKLIAGTVDEVVDPAYQSLVDNDSDAENSRLLALFPESIIFSAACTR